MNISQTAVLAECEAYPHKRYTEIAISLDLSPLYVRRIIGKFKKQKVITVTWELVGGCYPEWAKTWGVHRNRLTPPQQ